MEASQQPIRTSEIVLVIAISLIGTGLRFPGMFTELWFDEICSIRSAQSLHSAWAVLWSNHTDNKHHLIWLWMWLVGPDHADCLYRLPSLVAGVSLPPVLFFVARRESGRLAATLVMILASFCYPLIFYSSEARGYSMAALFGACAYQLVPDRHHSNSLAKAGMFSLAVVLGFLSHLTFVYVYAGLLVWAAVDAVHKPRAWSLVYHLPAIAILSLIYVFDVSKMHCAGGPPTAASIVLRWTLAMIFGIPFDGVLPWIVGAVVIWVAGIGLLQVVRKFGWSRGGFFIISIVLVPLVLTLTRKNPFLATRYYFVCIPFLLMLIATGLARACRSLSGKIVTALLVAAVTIHGVVGTWQLQLLGRGHVRNCLARMAGQSSADPIRYDSERIDMDQLNVDYYAQKMNPIRQFAVETRYASTWWILDVDSPLEQGPVTIRRQGAVYHLDSIYPSDSVSGLTWDLYKREPQAMLR